MICVEPVVNGKALYPTLPWTPSCDVFNILDRTGVNLAFHVLP